MPTRSGGSPTSSRHGTRLPLAAGRRSEPLPSWAVFPVVWLVGQTGTSTTSFNVEVHWKKRRPLCRLT
eukprot:747107-Hanusia_phi.AAC.14